MRGVYGSLVMEETWAKYLSNTDAFSARWEIRVLLDFNRGSGSKFLLSFEIDFTILHHFPGGLDLSMKVFLS